MPRAAREARSRARGLQANVDASCRVVSRVAFPSSIAGSGNQVKRPFSPSKWPKAPSKWKLGDASSIAIDAQDNVWVLHRPRTLKPDQAAITGLAFSPDREQQFLYVGGDKGIVVVDRKTLEIIGAIQVPGQLGPGHHIASDSKGNIYIAQTSAGLQKLTFKGMSQDRR